MDSHGYNETARLYLSWYGTIADFMQAVDALAVELLRLVEEVRAEQFQESLRGDEN